MKKSRLLILAMSSLLALAGCGGNSGQGGGGGGGEGDYQIKEDTTITIWTTYNDTYQTVLNNAIEEFKRIEPKVTINNVKQQGSYNDLAKMIVDGFAVDNYPDMACAYPDAVSDFIANGKALNIQPYMENPTYGWTSADYEDIPEAYIKLGQQYVIKGTYSLPASKSTEAMYYNQDALIGLNLSSIDATINGGKALNDAYIQNLTWEELFEKLIPALDTYDTAEKAAGRKGIIDKTKFTDWAWVGYDSDDNLFITLAEQYGYGYTGINATTGKGQVLFENDNMKALLKKFKGYYDNHYFTTKGIINTNVNYRSTADAMLFSIGSTGGVKYQFSESNKHNVGVAPVPHPANGQKKLISQGPDFAFLDHKNDNKAKATWLFFKLFTGTKYNTAWAMTSGYSPIRYSVMETEDYITYSDYENKSEKTVERLQALNAVYAGEVGDYQFSSPVFKGSSECRVQVGTIFAAMAGQPSLTDEKINEIFKTAADNARLKM